MIRSVIAVFLFVYLLGSPPLQPYLPPIMNTASKGFYDLVNGAVWNVTYPVYATVTRPFRSSETDDQSS